MRLHVRAALPLSLLTAALACEPPANDALRAAPISPSRALAAPAPVLDALPMPDLESARAERVEDRTFAPRLEVVGGVAGMDLLPVKEVSADVQIAGVIARVKVHQIFENEAARPLEAVYIFPASTRAAVHGMRMRIAGRTIEARIDRKAKARAEYEQARVEGRRASLLEQERPNVFTMNVTNLMPRERIEVELDYSELLVPEDSVYEFVYPTAVGPRYTSGEESQQSWFPNPHVVPAGREPFRFDVRVHVESGIGIKELSSPSHPVVVDYRAASSADVRLRDSGGADRDFVLRYRLAGDEIETGVVAWKDEREGFFAVLLQPPRQVAASQILAREYLFVLDVSGSMSGFPLETERTLVRDLLLSLKPGEKFNIVLFSDYPLVWQPTSLPADPTNVAAALAFIYEPRMAGGTELMRALRTAYELPQAGGWSRSVVLITDGFVTVEDRAFKFVRERLDQANLFAFGVGRSVNRALIEGLARAGQAEPFVALDEASAASEAQKFRAYLDTPVLTDIKVRFRGVEAYEVAPMPVPDLMARRPLVLFGKFKGEPDGRVELSGRSGDAPWSRSVELNAASLKAENSPLKWLWARKWVAMLEDEVSLGEAQALEDAIVDLGLTYHLLTRYTSFVATDSEVVNPSGMAQTVQQPQAATQGHAGYVAALGGSGWGQLGSSGGPARSKGPFPGGTTMGFGGVATKGMGHGGGGGAAIGLGLGGMGMRGTGGFGASGAAPVQRSMTLADASPVVSGSLDKDLLRAVIKRNIGQIRYCAEMALLTERQLSGKLVVRFVIGSSGEVISARFVEGTTIQVSQARECVLARVRSWRFPPPRAGGQVTVTYPFSFKS